MTPSLALHLIVPGPLDQRTGGYLYDARIVEGLRRLGWTITVHSLEGAFPLPDQESRASAAETLSRIPDAGLVVIDGLGLAAFAAECDSLGRVRALALIHHLTSDETGLNTQHVNELLCMETNALARCAGVVVTSPHTVSRVRLLEVPEERILPVVPGTDPEPSAVGPGPGEPPRLLCVGSLIPRKGQDVLVQALAEVLDRPWTCVLAGSIERDPHYASRVRALADDKGLLSRLRIVGECDRSQLDDLYHRSSVFVLPSHYEGYGMAITEALAHGLPVVSTTGGAIPDTLPADAGILVEPGNHRALAEAIRALLPEADPPSNGPVPERQRCALLAQAARRHAASLPDWERQSRAFADAVATLTAPS